MQAIAEPPTKSSTPRTIQECEADVVAGNAPAAPPVPATPKAPEGTPRISPLVCTLIRVLTRQIKRNSIFYHSRLFDINFLNIFLIFLS